MGPLIAPVFLDARIVAVVPAAETLPVAAIVLLLALGSELEPAAVIAPLSATSARFVPCCASPLCSSTISTGYSSVNASMIDTEPTDATRFCLNRSPVFSRIVSFCP
jgi:hypothetical protein